MNPSDTQLSRTLHNERIHNSEELLYPKHSASLKIREFQFVDQIKSILNYAHGKSHASSQLANPNH